MRLITVLFCGSPCSGGLFRLHFRDQQSVCQPRFDRFGLLLCHTATAILSFFSNLLSAGNRPFTVSPAATPLRRPKKSRRFFCGTEKVYYLCIPIRRSAYQMVDVAQLVRALDCGSRCRGFESHLPPSLQKEYDVEKRGLSQCDGRPLFRCDSVGSETSKRPRCLGALRTGNPPITRRTDRRPYGIPTSRDNGSHAPAHGSGGPAARGSALRDSP